MITDEEKGSLGIDIMHDIYVWFDTHSILSFKNFTDIQKNRHKDLDKAIKNKFTSLGLCVLPKKKL